MRALGIDLGTKSMGLAITDNDKIIVSPLRNCKFKTYDENQYIATLKEIIKINKYEDKIDLIVLGAPIQLNGSSSPWTKQVIRFGYLLRETFPKIKIRMQDERYSTKQAEGLLKKYDYKYSQIKKIKDEASAVIILLRYIENNK